MSYSRGVHLINPELDKIGAEFRTGRRHFSVNKNQSQGLVYDFDDRNQSRYTEKPPISLPAQSDYTAPDYSRPPDYDARPPDYDAPDPRRSDEALRLREMIRQRDEELRMLQEQQQTYSPAPATYPRMTGVETESATQHSKNPNYYEFERQRRVDVLVTQQRKRTAEVLAYQMSEKQRVKDLERQAREAEAIERLEHLRRLQDEDARKRIDQKQRATEYKRMLDIQAQSKTIQKAQSFGQSRSMMPNYENYYQQPRYQQPAPTQPLRDYTNSLDTASPQSYAQNAAAFFGDERPDYPPPPVSIDQPNTRYQSRAYPNTRQLLG